MEKINTGNGTPRSGDDGFTGGEKINANYKELVLACLGQVIWSEQDTESLNLSALQTVNKTNLISAINEAVNLARASGSQLSEFEVAGTSFGRFADGDTVPAHNSVQERFEDAYRNAIPPNWVYPTAVLNSLPGTSNSREVGETLNLSFTGIFNQNDGGVNTDTIFKKDGVALLSNTDTIVLSTTSVGYLVAIDYLAGTGTKPNNLGDDVPNPIQQGTATSPEITFRGYNPIFYGSTSIKYATSETIRASLTKRLTNSGNTWTLNTGSTDNVFQLWLPNGVNLVSVIDLDALNANITNSYISESLQVADAAGTLLNGTLYTMQQSVAYSSNHRHQITVSQ